MDDPNTRFIFYMVLVCEPTKGIGRTGETFSPVLVEISVAGQSLPAAGSRFRGVDCASILHRPRATNTGSLHSEDHRLRDDLRRSG
jgi:hypothetical protein